MGEASGLILLYHRVAAPRRDPFRIAVRPERFEVHCRVLAERAVVLPLSEFTRALAARALPPRAVAITVDDGYRDALVAAALLRHHDLTATVFVASGYVGSARPFWWDELDAACGARDGAGSAARAEVAERRLLAWWARLRRMPPERRDLVLRRLRTRSRGRRVDGSEGAGVRPWVDPDARPLTGDELDRLAAVEGIEIGSHSASHPSLTALTAAGRAAELEGSRAVLEARLGRPVTLLSYPFGGEEDVNPAVASEARAAGFTAAYTTRFAPAVAADDPYLLPRLTVGDWDEATFANWLETQHGGADATAA